MQNITLSKETEKRLSKEEFEEKYLKPRIPVVLKGNAKNWPAYEKWSLDYMKKVVGDIEVPLYDSSKADPAAPINASVAKMKFADYIELIRNTPTDLRIFLFDPIKKAPKLLKDYVFPKDLMGGFLDKYPTMFFGGKGSVTFLHYDIDMAHIFHTHFNGRKHILLFDYKWKETKRYLEGIREKIFPASVADSLRDINAFTEAMLLNDKPEYSSAKELSEEFKSKRFCAREKERVRIGIEAIDCLTGGLEGGDVTVIGARPSVGKTALATQMVSYACSHKKHVGYYSLEMSKSQVYDRFISLLSGIDLGHLRNATSFLNDDRDRFNRANMWGITVWKCLNRKFTIDL
jgi:hypothetical protein